MSWVYSRLLFVLGCSSCCLPRGSSLTRFSECGAVVGLGLVTGVVVEAGGGGSVDCAGISSSGFSSFF
jgi:hypothetical protein